MLVHIPQIIFHAPRAMEKIKHDLLEDYSEDKLTLLLFYFRNMTPVECMHFMALLLHVLDHRNSPIVLAFLLGMQSRSISFPRYAQKALNYHIHAINKKIAKTLPRTLHKYIPQMRLLTFADEGADRSNTARQRFDPMSYLVDSIFEILVRTSNTEIENGVRSYFNEDRGDLISRGPLTDSLDLLSKLRDEGAVDVSIVRIVEMLEVGDAPRLLQFMNENEAYVEKFFVTLDLLRPEVYEAVHDLIMENKQCLRLELIRSMVGIKMERLLEKITDETMSILSYLVQERDVHLESIVSWLGSGRGNISRSNMLSLFQENFDVLGKHASRFSLTTRELLDMAHSNDAVLPLALQHVAEQEEMNRLVDSLKERGDATVIELMESLGVPEKKDSLILTILRRKKLTGDLKKHMLGRYMENDRYLPYLLIYLEKSEILRLAPDHITDEESLNAFLKVVERSELLISAHRVPDISKAMKILDLSARSKSFGESDYLFALTTLEKELPLLIVRTLIQTLLKFPNLKNFVVSYASRLAKRDVWSQEGLFAGMVKCLEMIGSAAIDVILYLDEPVIVRMLGRSPKLSALCNEYLAKSLHSDRRPRLSLRAAINALRNKQG
jgi:symplekin